MRNNKGITFFKSFLAFVLLYGCCLSCKADTIDYWHVKYNNKLILEYTGSNANRLVTINLAGVKKADRITVNYGRDTPCSDCATELVFEDEKKKQYSIAKGKGTFNPLSFFISDIKKLSGKYFQVYYREGRQSKLLLFSIKLT